jgi:PAS domain S-box-containing protein
MTSSSYIDKLYPIAMAIGKSLDTLKMLQFALLQYMKRLECTGAVVFKIEKDNEGRHWVKDLFSVPYTLTLMEEYKVIDELFSDPFTREKLDVFISGLPLEKQIMSDQFLYIMQLNDFGFLLLIKKNQPLEPQLVLALNDINQKLATACVSCLNNEALKESEIRYRELSELLPEMICETDDQGFITYANRFAINRMGYKLSDIEKRVHITELVHEDDRPRMKSNFNLSLKKKSQQPNEYRAVTKTGEELSVLIYTSVIKKNKITAGIRGVMIDITERKKNEKKLNQYTERLELALIGSGASLWDWDIGSGEVFFSERWFSTLGFRRDELASNFSTLIELTHPEDRPAFLRILREHLEGKSDYFRSQHRLKTKEGNWIWILDTGRVTERDGNGNAMRAVGIHMDITSQRATELLDNIEHDLNLKLSKIIESDLTIRTFLDFVLEHSSMDAGIVYLPGESNKHFNAQYLRGFPQNTGSMDNPAGNPEQLTELFAKAPYYSSGVVTAEGYNIEGAYAILPMIYIDSLTGYLVVFSKKEAEITEFKKAILEKAASVAGFYIVRARQQDIFRQNMQDLDALFNTIDDFLFIMDSQGKIIHVNSVVYERLGYSSPEILNQDIQLFHPPDKREESIQSIKAMLGGKASACLVPLMTSSGELIPVETKVVSGKWENKDALIAISRDITEREKTDKILWDQREELTRGLTQQTLVSDISLQLNAIGDFNKQIQVILSKIGKETGLSRVYIFEDNDEGDYTSCKYEWCNSGIPSRMGKLQDVPYETIPSWKKVLLDKGRLYSDSIDELTDDIRKFLEPQKPGSIIVYPLFLKEKIHGFIGFDQCTGNKIWTKTELELFRTISGIISNTYERIIIEQSLVNERDRANRANMSKTEFLANMSHEIRTPMNAILGFSEALYHKMDSDQNKKIIKSILNSGNLLLSLLNDILDLSKIEAGKLVINLAPVDLAYIVNEITMLFTAKAQKKNTNITIEKSTSFPKAFRLDEIRIKQVLFNIVGNAVKFTENGEVAIKMSFEKKGKNTGCLVLEVEDTGIGIPAEEHERIFEAFNQQEGQSNRKYGGTGLGLAISKRLINKLGGTIELKSEPGVGSLFRILLPETEVVTVNERKVSSVNEDLKDLKFVESLMMVVDDVSSNTDAIRILLDSTGISIIAAESGEIALEILSHSIPSLILMDLRMPGIDGFELAERIRNNSVTREIPIIAYTASVFSREKIDESGLFNGYIFKPINRSDLLTLLKKFLPYKLQSGEKDNSTPVQENFSNIPAQTYKKIPEIISQLEGELLTDWNEIKDTFVIYKIEKFAKRLESIGKQYNLMYLVAYSKSLLDDIEVLDLESIRDGLKSYRDKIDYLKTL